ncbi:hypothetical protein LMH87_005757 [Akanthomyces muscarius]|uniref:Uncharacterized protein n=1 Tax=Akanthomyces muscarius TaxID=2231603 RepID=A0A9W8QMH7_AKAMU|nr:hypothetical protein LMH87_005757 [Akanthomyces muscarius]KAJ4164070.1 hypothetical protein LMH87_005757 [Akanthomyces muscarius]
MHNLAHYTVPGKCMKGTAFIHLQPAVPVNDRMNSAWPDQLPGIGYFSRLAIPNVVGQLGVSASVQVAFWTCWHQPLHRCSLIVYLLPELGFQF